MADRNIDVPLDVKKAVDEICLIDEWPMMDMLLNWIVEHKDGPRTVYLYFDLISVWAKTKYAVNILNDWFLDMCDKIGEYYKSIDEPKTQEEIQLIASDDLQEIFKTMYCFPAIVAESHEKLKNCLDEKKMDRVDEYCVYMQDRIDPNMMKTNNEDNPKEG